MHSNRKHIMMVKNKDQGVRKMVRTVINEPRITRKGLQKDLETACTSVTDKSIVIHSTPKASWTPHPQDTVKKRPSIEILILQHVKSALVHAASRSFWRPFRVILGSLITVLTIFLTPWSLFFNHHDMFPI